jgi:hypothetical protein
MIVVVGAVEIISRDQGVVLKMRVRARQRNSTKSSATIEMDKGTKGG